MAHTQPVHAENKELWEQARLAAYSNGYVLRRVQTNTVQWIGWHRYLALEPHSWAGIRARGCVHYEEAPNSRWWKPAIHSEASALARLRDAMHELAGNDPRAISATLQQFSQSLEA